MTCPPSHTQRGFLVLLASAKRPCLRSQPATKFTALPYSSHHHNFFAYHIAQCSRQSASAHRHSAARRTADAFELHSQGVSSVRAPKTVGDQQSCTAKQHPTSLSALVVTMAMAPCSTCIVCRTAQVLLLYLHASSAQPQAAAASGRPCACALTLAHTTT